MVDKFSQILGSQQLLISSRSGVLRPLPVTSDNSKDEAHMIFILMHTGKILLFTQIFQNKRKTETEHHTSET